jgi:transcriptional regulator of arginine metabolism
MKTQRQSAILDAVQRQPVRSQEELRRRIRVAGFDVTQATLSRDIRELELMKGGADGAYQAPASRSAAAPSSDKSNGHGAATLLQKALSEYLTRADQVQQLVLLRTGPGQAQILALAIDGARLPEVVGTVAGDDTILVISRGARQAKSLVKHFEAIAAGAAAAASRASARSKSSRKNRGGRPADRMVTRS